MEGSSSWLGDSREHGMSAVGYKAGLGTLLLDYSAMDVDLKRTAYYPYLGAQEPVLVPGTQPNPVLVINANAAEAQPKLGPVAQILCCPHCRSTMETRLEPRVTKHTHAFAFALCLTGLFCLVPLPYCLKSCQSVDHYCSQCNRFLGKASS
ncbi:lipopolysaccharide-induced tumor necrosis factor-alpha factor homolog [Drosophila obscura]|uniref:lipopolysaccharide-induced tumor necrosis factor-alpha factor homolog n=1 Tax=Drosophila obscura TaxID=7282 RepID=UPI001BB2232F|nr:lipopolysaccharide-induced tumor necrosis factor-alpha factor homolog [Drosophila obscura]